MCFRTLAVIVVSDLGPSRGFWGFFFFWGGGGIFFCFVCLFVFVFYPLTAGPKFFKTARFEAEISAAVQ